MNTFNLCKIIYEKTKWDGNKKVAYDLTYSDNWERDISEFPKDSREYNLENMIPKYDEDYLINKIKDIDGVKIEELDGKISSLTYKGKSESVNVAISEESKLNAILLFVVNFLDIKENENK